MTDAAPPRRGRPPCRRATAVRGVLGGLAALALAFTLAGCGASAALGSAVLAPLSVLPDTDVALETNLQAAVQGGLAGGGLGGVNGSTGVSAGGGSSNSGVPEVSGPPTSPNEVSVASTTGVSVYSAFNPVDRHCLGTLVLAPGSASIVLGESTPGSYDFWFGPTTSTACTASSFLTQAKVPSGWATGDPSSSGFPLP